MKNIITIIIVSFWATTGFAQSFNSQKIDSLFSILDENNKFMGSIAVSQNQKEIYKNSIGFIDVENGIKANTESKYRIGSISKMLTASLILKAVDEKKLELNQTINTFFPTIKNANTITIENLLNHSSGVHSFTNDKDYTTWYTLFQSKEKMIERIQNGGSDFMPNEKSEYSNSNYLLLTFILEEVYEQPFSELLKEQIIEPLQLKNTYYGNKTNTKNNESFSYSYLGKWTLEPETDLSVPQGAGGIVSNPSDLNIFIENLFLGNIVSKESLEKMKTIKNGYGMGLFQLPYNDKVSYGHGGSIDGFQSVTSYFPAEKLAITITSNGVNYSKNDILLAVLATYFNDSYILPTFKQIELTTEDLDKYLGIYSGEGIPVKITITKEGTTLLAQATDQPSFPLDATAKDIFTFDSAGIKIEFNPSTKTMVLYQGGGEFKFKME